MVRRTRVAAVLVAMFLVSAVTPAATLAAKPTLRSTVVQSGLSIPWDVAFAPGGQMFVTERAGRVRVYANGNKGANLLATSTISNMRAQGEAGLMGIAVDHLFNSNRLIYVCASRQIGGGPWINQVLRYRVQNDWELTFDRYIISSGMRANTIHNGCAVEEGPDFKLWITMGDANSPYDAQDPKKLNGKVLRVERNGNIPTDNPIMPGNSTRTAVYSMGHRNPQGIAFHPPSKRAYAIEHGPDRSDEINWIRAGRNYGWPCRTGFSNYLSCSGGASFTNPIWQSGSSTIATSGAAFVKGGSKWLAYKNNLFVSQLKQSDLRRFKIESTGSPATYKQTFFNGRWGRLRAAVLGSGNRLFLTTSNGSNDKVIRINAGP